MKKYLVFAGHNFYPSGGWCDFLSSHDDEKDAIIAGLRSKKTWYQVVDISTGTLLHNEGVPGSNQWS